MMGCDTRKMGPIGGQMTRKKRKLWIHYDIWYKYALGENDKMDIVVTLYMWMVLCDFELRASQPIESEGRTAVFGHDNVIYSISIWTKQPK